MSSSLFQILNISRQDMLGRLDDLEAVSNNLANVNTAGYKSSRMNFQELLANQTKEGMKLSSSQLQLSQGTFKRSDNLLDWAISGDGFFAVKLADGTTGYTRDGQFQLDGKGQLVTASGNPLVWQGTVPADATKVSVQADGTVIAQQGVVWNTIGKVQLTRFTNASGLKGNGDNIWLATNSSGAPQTGAPNSANLGVIQAGAVEQSNVNLAYETTHMMTLERNFQMSVKAFQQTDQMISQAIHLRKV